MDIHVHHHPRRVPQELRRSLDFLLVSAKHGKFGRFPVPRSMRGRVRQSGIPFGLVPNAEEIVEAHRHPPLWVFLRVEEISRLRIPFPLFVVSQHFNDLVLEVAVPVGVARLQLVGDPEASINDHLLPYAEGLLFPVYAIPGYRQELAPSRPEVEEEREHDVSHRAFGIRIDELPYLLLVEYVLLRRGHLGDLEVLYRPHHVPMVVA